MAGEARGEVQVEDVVCGEGEEEFVDVVGEGAEGEEGGEGGDEGGEGGRGWRERVFHFGYGLGGRKRSGREEARWEGEEGPGCTCILSRRMPVSPVSGSLFSRLSSEMCRGPEVGPDQFGSSVSQLGRTVMGIVQYVVTVMPCLLLVESMVVIGPRRAFPSPASFCMNTAGKPLGRIQ